MFLCYNKFCKLEVIMDKKVALITGSAKGIGSSIAKTLALSGFDIVVNYNTSELDAKKLKQEIEAMGSKCIIAKCDISNELEVKQMVTDILKHFKRIDVLVNNAGVCFNSLFKDKSVEEFKRTLEVNVIGTYLVSKYVGQEMYNQKSGKIINISSTNGINTYFPMCIDYDASKSAIISLTHNLAIQFAPYVNVNAIAPGFIKTASEILDMDQEYIDTEVDKILVKRIGEEQDVANLVEFLASDKSNFINNEVIRVDGGLYGNL